MGRILLPFLVSHFLQGTYCFQPGVLAGFTGFALAVLIAWTSPMLITALWVSNKPKRESEINVETFLKIWSLLTALWFIFPCAWFISDPFFRRDGFGILLAVTVAAAFPLSWHLSLVAVLSTTLSETLGMTRSSTLAVHKVVGYGAAGWAAVHAIGELVYFSRHGWDFFWKQLSLAKAEDGGKPTVYLGDSCICGLCISYGTSASTQEGEQLQKPPPRRRGPAPAHCCSALVAFLPCSYFQLQRDRAFALQAKWPKGRDILRLSNERARPSSRHYLEAWWAWAWCGFCARESCRTEPACWRLLFSHLQQFWRSLFQRPWSRCRFCSESLWKALKLWPSMPRSVFSSLHEPPGALGLKVSRSLKKTTSMMNQGWREIGHLKHLRPRVPRFGGLTNEG